MTRRRRAASNDQGFTLLEVIVAMTLLAVILGLATGGFRFGARAWEAGEATMAQSNDFHTTYRLMRRLLARAYPLPVGPEEDLRFLFEGTEDRLRFVALLPPYPGRPGPYVVTFENRESDDVDAFRLTIAPLNPDQEDHAGEVFDDLVLAPGPVAVAFSYQGDLSGGDWAQNWTSGNAFPRLVRMRVTGQGTGNRPWPTLTLPVAIDMDAACVFEDEGVPGKCRLDE